MTAKLPTMSLTVAAFLVCCAAQLIVMGKARIQNSNSSELAESAKLTASVIQLFGEGKYKQALPLAKRALDIREKALNAGDNRLRAARINMAEIYLAVGQYDAARELFERIIRSQAQIAPNEPPPADVLQRLALVEFGKGNLDKTEELYKKAVEINEKSVGTEHPKFVKSIFLLAEFYQHIGQFKKAEPLYKRFLAITENSPSTAYEDRRAGLDRYECLLYKLKRVDQARELRAQSAGVPPSGLIDQGDLSGGMLNGKAITLPKPSYPAEARAARVSGKVKVEVVIDEDGSVIRACAVEGEPLLTLVSEKAAYAARFTPTLVNGQPVKVTGVIVYRFIAP